MSEKILQHHNKILTPYSNNSRIPISFLFHQRGIFVTGSFLYKYTIHKGRKTENGKYVCTSAADRVHTVGGVSSDIAL